MFKPLTISALTYEKSKRHISDANDQTMKIKIVENLICNKTILDN
jgi:hypothetical protein